MNFHHDLGHRCTGIDLLIDDESASILSLCKNQNQMRNRFRFDEVPSRIIELSKDDVSVHVCMIHQPLAHRTEILFLEVLHQSSNLKINRCMNQNARVDLSRSRLSAILLKFVDGPTKVWCPLEDDLCQHRLLIFDSLVVQNELDSIENLLEHIWSLEVCSIKVYVGASGLKSRDDSILEVCSQDESAVFGECLNQSP